MLYEKKRIFLLILLSSLRLIGAAIVRKYFRQNGNDYSNYKNGNNFNNMNSSAVICLCSIEIEILISRSFSAIINCSLQKSGFGEYDSNIRQ